jgi:hypothetical protein
VLAGPARDILRSLDEVVGCGLTTISSPRPVNLAGEVLYRSILGRVRGAASVRGSGEGKLEYESCSMADIDARGLNPDMVGGGEDAPA